VGPPVDVTGWEFDGPAGAEAKGGRDKKGSKEGDHHQEATNPPVEVEVVFENPRRSADHSISDRPVRRRKTSSSVLLRTSVDSGRMPLSWSAADAASPFAV